MVRNAVAHNTETWDEVWDLADALEIGAVMNEEHKNAMWTRLRKRLEDCEADWVRGIPDFLGEPDNTQNLVQTMHAGGPGKLIHCLKCPNCGYSVTA